MKPTSLLLLAVVAMTGAGLAPDALAQKITIETSADNHDSRFFGEGVLRVIVTDPDADNDNAIEEIEVDVEADPESGSADSDSIIVPETNESSGRFEFFLLHVNATAVDASDLDSINSAGVDGDGTCVADCAPFISFGPSGDLDIQSDLYEKVAFEIIVDDAEIEINYEETAGDVELDRYSYGSTSFVYISVKDQDSNLNPTERDEFTIDPNSSPNDDLLTLDGGTFEDIVVFSETGDNSAVFEGRYRLGVSITVDSESIMLTLHDKANYNATLAAPENDSNNIDEVSFTVGDSSGTIEVGGSQPAPTWDPTIATDKDSYSMHESVRVTITDQDANVNPGATDSISLQISSGSSNIEVAALETGADTGVFEASFQLAQETNAELGAIAPGGSATITYTDERPADYSEKVEAGENPEKDFTLEIDVQLPVRTGVGATEMTAPLAEDAAGGTGPYAVGASLTLSMTISNNNDQPQPFVALVEVRDSDGITVFIALQGGTLDPLDSSDIGVLWQPDRAGTFEARTFAVADIGGGEVLSPVAASEITVSQAQ